MANESKHFIQYLKESTQNKEYGALIQICPLLRDIKFGGPYFSLNIQMSNYFKGVEKQNMRKVLRIMQFLKAPALAGGLCEDHRS